MPRGLLELSLDLDYFKTALNGIKQYVQNVQKKLEKGTDKKIKDNTPDWNQNDPEGKGYIANRPFYTEEAEDIVTYLPGTYSNWLKIVGSLEPGTDGKTLSFSLNGQVYENMTPKWLENDAQVWNYEIEDSDGLSTGFVVYRTHGRLSVYGSAADKGGELYFITKTHKDEIVHKIPDKYYSRRFVITITGVNPDNITFTTDKTYDEIVDAYNNGEPVVLCVAGAELPLYSYNDGAGFNFINTMYVGNDSTNITGIEVRITPDKNTISSSQRMTLGEMSGVSANQIPIITEVLDGRPIRFGAIDVPEMDYSLALTSCSPGQILVVKTVDSDGKPLTWEAVDANEMVLNSSTSGSTKKFKITVDDFGTISTTEVIT